jgi:hypothetical protein
LISGAFVEAYSKTECILYPDNMSIIPIAANAPARSKARNHNALLSIICSSGAYDSLI